MPLHCAATRPKFLNVPFFLFRTLWSMYWLPRDTWELNITIFNDFLFSSVSSLAFWCQLVRAQENLKTRRHKLQSSTILRHEFAYVLLLLENHQVFAKITKNVFLVVRADFLIFWTNRETTPVVFDEKSRTGLGFEIKQLVQRKNASVGPPCNPWPIQL